jgi:hypothetical protein
VLDIQERNAILFDYRLYIDFLFLLQQALDESGRIKRSRT